VVAYRPLQVRPARPGTWPQGGDDHNSGTWISNLGKLSVRKK
jgi:hypothetical protein